MMSEDINQKEKLVAGTTAVKNGGQQEMAAERIRAVIESAVDGILVIDSSGIVEEYNPAARRIFGYEKEEVLGQNVKMLMPPPYREGHDGFIHRYLQTGEKRVIGIGRKVVGRRKDGSTFPMDLSVSQMKVGESIKFTGIVRDTSEQEMAAERVRAVIESAVDGILVIDTSGTVEEYNLAACRMFGYAKEEVLGQNVKMLMPFPYRDKHDEFIKRYLQTGEKKVIGIGRKVVGKRKDGSTFPLDLSVSQMKVGQSIKFTGIVRDISEQEMAAERIRAVIESAVDGILVIDSSGLVEEYNPAARELFGYSTEEVLGQNVKMLMPPQYREHHDGYIQSYLRTGVKRVIGIGRRVIGLRKDGSTFPMHLSVSEMKIGNSIKFTGIVRDMSKELEAMRMKEHAESESKAKSEFLCNMSHEFRTPLNGIMGTASLLYEQAETEGTKECADIILTSSRALLSIVNDLLDYSKLAAGKMVLVAEHFDLLLAMENVVDLLYGEANKKGLLLYLDFPPDIPRCYYGDSGRIRQIVLNFVSNSLKFTRKGHIAIKVRGETKDASSPSPGNSFRPHPVEAMAPPGDDVTSPQSCGQRIVLHLSVEDTGIGIPEEKKDVLFERFAQLDNSQTNGGTGIGLSICKHLAALLEGEVTVESEVDSGSTFTLSLSLPVAEEEEEEAKFSGLAVASPSCSFLEPDLQRKKAEGGCPFVKSSEGGCPFVKSSISDVTSTTTDEGSSRMMAMMRRERKKTSRELPRTMGRNSPGSREDEQQGGEIVAATTSKRKKRLLFITQRVQSWLPIARYCEHGLQVAESCQVVGSISEARTAAAEGFSKVLFSTSSSAQRGEERKSCFRDSLGGLKPSSTTTSATSAFHAVLIDQTIIAQHPTLTQFFTEELRRAHKDLDLPSPIFIYVSNGQVHGQEEGKDIPISSPLRFSALEALMAAVDQRLLDISSSSASLASPCSPSSSISGSPPSSPLSTKQSPLGFDLDSNPSLSGATGALSRRASQVPNLSDPPPGARYIFTGTRILLAEDCIVNQKVATMHLKRLGCAVDTVANGSEAVKKLQENNSYDIVLLDIHMPVMDGFTAARKIREEEAKRQQKKPIPLVALTASVMSSTRSECTLAGMNWFISKPVAAEVFLELLQRYVPHLAQQVSEPAGTKKLYKKSSSSTRKTEGAR